MATTIRILFNNLPAIQAALKPAADQAIRKSLLDAQSWIQQDMAAGKSGRVYGAHQASAPGETPAIDTGGLVGSLQVANVGELHGELTAGGPAVYLEFGTVRMSPRPFMQPAAAQVAPGLGKAIADILEGGVA